MKRSLLWFLPMFTYGCLREYNSSLYIKVYPNDSDHYPKTKHLVNNSIMNGVYYMSPAGLWKLYHLYQRIKDYKTKTKYDINIYKEWSYNYNMNIFF